MIPELWKCKFKIDDLRSARPLREDNLSFDTIQNQIIGSANLVSPGPLHTVSAVEIMREGLEAAFSLIHNARCQLRIEDPELANMNELIVAGQPIGGVSDFSVAIYCDRPLSMPEEVSILWEKYQSVIFSSLAPEEKEKILRPVRWYLRAVRSNDTMDRFINGWMTFELLLTFFSETMGSIKLRMDAFIEKKGVPSQKRTLLVNKHTDAINSLANAGIVQRLYPHIPVSDELKAALAHHESADEIFRKTVFVIAAIRNNLFHGDIVDWTSYAQECINFVMDFNARTIRYQLEEL